MLTHRFDDALACAAAWHRTQTRKGTSIPYLSHLMAVSALVLEHGGDENTAIAGLLHDAIEDAGQSRETLSDRFGPDVAAIVAECSDSDGTAPKPAWDTRKHAYLANLPQKSAKAILVTTCDKLHNATAIAEDLRRHGPAVFDRFTAGRDGTLWYYRSLADSLARLARPDLGRRLARAVAEMEHLAA
ncbi:HD domain-containing protein [Marimonas arenosa]|uniref:HD domain-containing protein n=1 Tax=Marimonas arenosa TaxID=1795305 RepID=A0AAE4B5R3_9RHOB|nr:HD domain-containing protein [Marimonas arenosa]MDQ2091432.1 HD domain-containing protein [Marimonas arenosa]